MTLKRIRPAMAALAAAATAAAMTLGVGAGVAGADPAGIPSTPSDGGLPTGGVGPIQTTFPAASDYSKKHPGTAPTGVNDPSCRPMKGSRPVVLIPGTNEDAYATWSYYAPKLADAGLCVYTFNHNPLEINGKRVEWATFNGDIAESAEALGSVVDRVLEWTGADQVDLVGHSQGGGPLPHWYIKELGGAPKVHRLIGLVPSNHGTTLLGVNRLIDAVPGMRQTLENATSTVNAQANMQQITGSDMLATLAEGGFTRPGVQYDVITTRNDDVVIPYTSAIIDEPGVSNEIIQDRCALDLTDHFGFTYDPVAYQVVENKLTGDDKPVPCVPVAPYLQ